MRLFLTLAALFAGLFYYLDTPLWAIGTGLAAFAALESVDRATRSK
jgi:hypothetical protein